MRRAIFAACVCAFIGYAISQSTDPKKVAASDGLSQWDHIYIEILADGTRCAVYKGSQKGGVSCDWNGDKYTKDGSK